MHMWHLLLSYAIVAVSPALPAPSQVTTTPYFLLMPKTLYQKSVHYIVTVYNKAPSGSYAIQVDSINPFTKEVKRGDLTREAEMGYKIPFIDYPEESIRLNITIFSCTKSNVCLRRVATESRLLSVITDPSVNLIQIRRSSYHSGELVQFRVIPYVSKRVALLDGKIKEIYIKNANGQRVQQWNNVSFLKAFEGLNFTLPAMSPFGTWRINLVINQNIDFEEFRVNDVPRPMFTVQLRQLKYLRLDAKFFTFQVCAEYPFIESMEASINVTFCVVEYHHVSFSRLVERKHCFNTGRGFSDIKECMPLKESTKKLNLDSVLKRYKENKLLSLKTLLTVEVKQRNGYSVRKNITGDIGDKQMVLEVDSPSVYKPGLPYRGSVSVKDMDGEPVDDAEVILLMSSPQALNKSFNPINHNGTFKFGFFPMSSQTGTIKLHFIVVKSSKLSKNMKMELPSVTKLLTPARSKLGAFLDIEVDESKCTRYSIPFRLRSTVSLDKNNIRAAVISERNFTSYFPFTTYPVPEVCEDTDDPILGHYRCVKGRQIRCLKGWHGDNCLLPVCQKGKCLPKSSQKPLERLTTFLRRGTLDVFASWHPNTQLVIWSTLTKNNITDVISARAIFRRAEKCSQLPHLPSIALDKSLVEHSGPMVVSMTYDKILKLEKQKADDITCSLSVARECKIGCGKIVSNVDSSDGLHKLVEEYLTWCHRYKDKNLKDNLLVQDFDDAGFIVATNFPMNRKAAHRMRRSTDFRVKRSSQESPAQTKPFSSETSAGTWNLHTFKGALKKLKIKAPASPGKWKAQLMCITPLGIRISPPAMFSVKKIIHLEALLPMRFKEGEAHSVPISLFYKRKFCSTVKVEATASNNAKVAFKSLKGEMIQNTFQWCDDRHSVLSILVEPLRSGTLSLTIKVTATSEKPSRPHVDLIQRNISIEAKGRLQVETVEHLSCESNPHLIPLKPPKVSKEKIVQGSEKIEICLSGNTISKKITNLISLVRPPSWRREENAGILSVNMQLLEYYNVTGFKNKNILRRLHKYINEGYKRILTLKTPDGSFANFKNYNTTSTWFTTLVFTNIWKYNRDLKSLKPTLEFILFQQSKRSGCFREQGSISSFSLAGGFRERHFDRRILTTFVLSNLKDVYDAGGFRRQIAPALQAGHQCLRLWLNRTRHLNTFTLSIAAEALGKMKSSSTLTRRVFEELMKREQMNKGQRFWLTQHRKTSYWNVRLASDTETTARAVLAKFWIKKKTELSDVVPALRWLVEARNDHRWYTFMDQVEALKALTVFAKVTNFNGPFNPVIDVLGYMNDAKKAEFEIRQKFTKVRRDVVFQSVYAKSITKLKCNRLGAGCVLITVRKYYNTR